MLTRKCSFIEYKLDTVQTRSPDSIMELHWVMESIHMRWWAMTYAGVRKIMTIYQKDEDCEPV